MKRLLIGFHKYDDNMYPHLRCFIDQLSERSDLAYFHFRERGYFVQHMSNQRSWLRSWIIGIKAMCFTAVDALNLWLNYRNYDTIIAIDHYAYAIADFLFKKKKIILWSHDVISYDSAIYNNIFVHAYMKACSKALVRNRRIIIQDEERLGLLKKSLGLDDNAFDVLYLPVSLGPTGMTNRVLSSEVKPRLLQSGGIGAYRCSDKLLSHYQNYSDFYRLYFHGFIFQEIKNQLVKCAIQPMVSCRAINPKFIHQLNDFCDIGFVCYADEENMNFFLIAKASGQFVEFLRLGLPVIAMGKNNLGQFVKEQGVGVGIQDMSELTHAIETIAKNYQDYSKNCFHCFDQHFNFEKYVPQISAWL
jgi:hypothetical protein